MIDCPECKGLPITKNCFMCNSTGKVYTIEDTITRLPLKPITKEEVIAGYRAMIADEQAKNAKLTALLKRVVDEAYLHTLENIYDPEDIYLIEDLSLIDEIKQALGDGDE